jgi:hypothetical protein
VPLFLFKKQKPDLASYIEIEFSKLEGDINIISAKITNNHEIDGVGKTQGELRITDKGFGFVGDTFIPPHLAKQELSGNTVEVLRYRDIDKAKNKMGWEALTVNPVT